VNTMGAGLRTVDDHLRVLETAAGILQPQANNGPPAVGGHP